MKKPRAKINSAISKQLALKLTVPDAGHERFFVANHKLGIYTSIGANNVHHASNKATKLFGPHWSFLRGRTNTTDLNGLVWTAYKEFKDLIKTLKN